MAQKGISEEIEMPSGVMANVEGSSIIIKGAKGETKRKIADKGIKITEEGGKLALSTKSDDRQDRKLIGTYRSHIKNMIYGVTQGHAYAMKICSGHFPMSVAFDKGEFVVKNFFGEKTPRKVKLMEGVSVKISGSDVTVEGADKEAVSESAALIEQLTKRTKYDRRIYQDGIYVISKNGKRIK